MSQYAGDPNAFPVDFPLPDDAAAPTAAEINPALEALGDRTAFLLGHSPRFRIVEFLASGTYTTGERIVSGLLIGCGGGGGGGGAAAVGDTDESWIAGGGGGGGALLSVRPVVLLPSTLYNIDIGAGGGGGLAGVDGGNGGDTGFRLGATVLAKFGGAMGGSGSRGIPVGPYWEHFSLGGAPRLSTNLVLGNHAVGVRYDSAGAFGFGGQSWTVPIAAASGGYGQGGSQDGGTTYVTSASAGSRNPSGGFNGGAAGARGADSGNSRGGGGGGGGGAGPFGNGAIAGDGGSFANTGGNGSFPGANTGAGGGGGGSSGKGSALAAGLGGDGGSGRLYLVIAQESP